MADSMEDQKVDLMEQNSNSVAKLELNREERRLAG